MILSKGNVVLDENLKQGFSVKPLEKSGKNKILKFIKNYEFSKHLLFAICLAFAFSFIARLYWIYWASTNGDPVFFWNDQVMINTNDGYAFAEGARDYLAGFHQPNDLSYYWTPPSILTAWLNKILPFSFETILLYMPIFFSSLIVVPILLISSEFRCIRAGFVGALIASVANSYYNRTMAGYYDTDMLNIILAMMVLWSLIRICTKGDKISLISLGASVAFYQWWYSSSFSLNVAMFGVFAIYSLIFSRKKINLQAAIVFILAITTTAIYIKILLIVVVLAFFFYKKEMLNFKILFGIFGLVLVFFIYRGGLSPIWFQLKFYIFRSVADSGDVVYKFFNVNQTIQESGIVPAKIFMERISSHVLVFVASLIGYVYLCYRHKEYIISLPILLLGFAANKAGLRFTIYSVGVMGLGFGYILYSVVKFASLPRFLQRAIIFVVTFAALIPAGMHIYDYKVTPVFYQSEVEVLDTLKKVANPEDYVVSWWDYGYAIRYYADVKTLIDGGKHLGNDNFPVSFALTKDQISSANMARIDVEYTERNFKEKFKNKISTILQEYKISDIDDFLINLKFADFTPPKATRDIYYYLPDRMMNILEVISKFSDINLKTGKVSDDGLFYIAQYWKFDEKTGMLHLGNGVVLDTKTYSIHINNERFALNSYAQTMYDKNGKLSVEEAKMDSNSKLHLIFMKDYGRFLLLDDKYMNSAYIQLFVLERYNQNIYEPVILSPAAKIYKLKR